MNDFTDVLESIAQNARRGHERAGDYRGEDGLLYCGRCRTRKEHRLELDTDPPKVVTVPVMCKCEEERQEAQRKEEERIKFRQDCERLRRDGITDPSYLVNTFAQDDNRNPAVSDVCRKYVDHWEEMKADNIGILFYGGVGTGKSFLACCIANALIDRCVKASVTNFPRIMNRLQGFGEDKQGFLDKLNRYDCLVIDDLGVERDTSYSVEQIYNVVDARSRSGKPLIVTTNLSLDDLRNPSSMGYPNDFSLSYLKDELNGPFLAAFDTAGGPIRSANIVTADWSLADHRGGFGYGNMKAKISLLPETLFLKYKALLSLDDWWWLVTPRAGGASGARVVSSDGSLVDYDAYYGSLGVRPAFFAESGIILESDGGEAVEGHE